MSMTTWPSGFPSSTTPLWLNPNLTALPAPQVGSPSTVSLTIAFTDDTSALGAIANFWAFEPTVAITQSTLWSNIIGSASWSSLQSSVLPPVGGDTSSVSQVWTPSSDEQGHTCLLALVTCLADPSGITANTPWSSAENNYHVAWHNYDVASVPAAAVKAARKSYKYSIPVLANTPGTVAATIRTRRVPLSENSALMAGVPAAESQSTFGLSHSATSQRKSFAGMPVDVVNFDIIIPRDVEPGSAACFEIASLLNGTALNGYRVLMQFV